MLVSMLAEQRALLVDMPAIHEGVSTFPGLPDLRNGSEAGVGYVCFGSKADISLADPSDYTRDGTDVCSDLCCRC
jgi:hypothetical protein